MSKKADKKLIVDMISESEFTVQGHGVHTAYKEITDALRKRKDIDIEVNSRRPADIIHIQTMGLYSFRHLIRRGGKKVVSAHIVPDSFIGSIKGAKYWKPLGKMWLKFFYKKADLVLACSGMVADELINDMNVPKTKVLYNTIDMSRYRHSAAEKKLARKNLGLKDNDFVVMGNGQVQPRKRLDIPQYDDTFKGDAVMAKTDDEFLDLIDLLRKDKKAYSKACLGAEKIAKRFDSSAGAERLVEFYRSLI